MDQNILSFEEMKSSNQLLSFNYVNEIFAERDMRFTEVQQRVLGIRNADNKFTNLGLWLSDQNPITTKVTVFHSDNLSVVDKTIEFAGSLLKQYFDILEFIKKHNRTQRTFIRGHREDVWNYPKEAIEETVLNMIIHRDYEIKGSNTIKILEDRIEIITFGALPLGIKFDELFIGMSVTRNKCLANFFKHIRLASGFGLGIGKIRDSYYQSLAFPRFRVNDDVFKVTLPNQKYAFEGANDGDEVHLSLSETNKMLGMLEILKEQKALTKKEIQECLQVSSTRCLIIIDHLVKKDLLEIQETENGKVYTRPR